MTYLEFFDLVKNLSLSGATITGAVVAVKGLSTWKRQLKGQSDYDLSRSILVSMYKYRNAINGVRHPAMFAEEMLLQPDADAEGMSLAQIRFQGKANAYQARWDKVQNELIGLNAYLLEAEALWGDELKGRFEVLFTLQHELFTCIRHFLELLNPDVEDDRKEAIKKFDENLRDIMYDNLAEDGDDYKKDFKIGVESIEIYLKPKLAHK